MSGSLLIIDRIEGRGEEVAIPWDVFYVVPSTV